MYKGLSQQSERGGGVKIETTVTSTAELLLGPPISALVLHLFDVGQYLSAEHIRAMPLNPFKA